MTWHSSHVGLFPLLVLSTLDCAHVLFRLLGSLSTWDFIFFDSVHSKVSQHDELLTKDCVYSWFCPDWILLTFGSVYLGVCPGGCLPTLILSAWESGLMTSLPHRKVSSIGSVNSGLCSLLVLSSWESCHITIWNVGFCPLLVLLTLDSAHIWFCLLWSPSTWVLVYLESAYLGVWPHDILPT